MATSNFVDQVLDRVVGLISVLHCRFTDGSIMNVDIPSYVIRLDVSINNIVRFSGRLSNSVYHEIITGLQELVAPR